MYHFMYQSFHVSFHVSFHHVSISSHCNILQCDFIPALLSRKSVVPAAVKKKRAAPAHAANTRKRAKRGEEAEIKKEEEEPIKEEKEDLRPRVMIILKSHLDNMLII